MRDKVDFENGREITDAMAGHDLTPDQEDYFDLLCRLVEDYEKERGQLATRTISGLDALQHLLAEQGMKGEELARLLALTARLGDDSAG